MLNDLRFAVRQMGKSPGFSLIVILTLALGVGANTAIFSVVDAVLLEPLPYAHADRVVQVCEMPQPKAYIPSAAGGVFADWQDESTQLQYVAAAHDVAENLTGFGEPMRVDGEEVSADYLKVFGVTPKLGRDFLPAEDSAEGNHDVVVVSYELWQAHLGADPAIVGRVIHLDGKTLTVIGVLPAHALFANSASFLVPSAIRASPHHMNRDYNYVVSVTGRLRPGATVAQASEELAVARRSIKGLYPVFKQQWTAGVEPLQTLIFGNMRPYVLTLLGAVGVVLLIACANVANLLLARGTARRAEVALRLALGATPWRIVRQLLTESMVFALAAGILGLVLGIVAVHPLIVFAGIDAVAGLSIGINVRILLFTFGTAWATGLIFGLVPAWNAVRSSLAGDLKEGARGSTSGTGLRVQSALLISETAMTVVLLACAGLLLRSFVNAMRTDCGFNAQNVLVFDLSVPASKAPTTPDRVRFDRLLIDRLVQVPGVTKVGTTSSVPMNGNNNLGDIISREDRPATRNDASAGFDSVGGDFFQTLQIPLLSGRFLDRRDDRPDAPKVLVVNEALVRKFFGNENPLGRQMHFKDAAWEIVGVVGNVKRYQLDAGEFPQVFFARTYFPWRTSVVVRTTWLPSAILPALRQAVADVDPDLPIANLHTLQEAVDNTLHIRRVMLVLLGIFGAVALTLACVGIYGVISYSVAQRTREIGIRIALGASVRQVISLVLRQSVVLVLFGILLGVLASIGAGALISSQLFDVSRTDPAVLTAVSAGLMCVALLASWRPAFRASRVNPSTALRSE
ncbi:MAG TPA: ABC transporter permease [Opitutaceae bacterium]|jgi:predicted permease